MRKLQQLAVLTMAVGSLAAFGAGVSFADTTGQQAPQGTQGMPDQAAPQAQQPAPQTQVNQQVPQTAQVPQGQQTPQGTQVAPQVSPQLSPNVTIPENLPLLPAAQAQPQEQNNLFRPYQECSPQTVLQANIPIALLGESTTQGDTCTQVNNAFNQQ
ncbi:hypothetical protein [Streptomyces sp. NRRL F-5123]|uniref:hypothetical protein n=1 Tax=Streptomyces sp. NRRL F-5123 TaxID=1463856 RepID=UPI0004E17BA6|nr:hypothetical protein [Streptomyces sp. NRRL F-5123]